MCITLAQELHAGARVAADPRERRSRARSRLQRRTTRRCLQRGIWIESTDTDEAAELFMRGCQAERTDSITTQMSCGKWMTLLDEHVYEPNDGDQYAGLSRICALEESGALVPGTTLTDGSISTHYAGGACGTLERSRYGRRRFSKRDSRKSVCSEMVTDSAEPKTRGERKIRHRS